jgi:hypothetical protein
MSVECLVEEALNKEKGIGIEPGHKRREEVLREEKNRALSICVFMYR